MSTPIPVEALLRSAADQPGLACFDTAEGETFITWGSGEPPITSDDWRARTRASLDPSRDGDERFSGGVVGWIGYEAGRAIERMPEPSGPRPTHDVCLWRVDGALVLGPDTRRWRATGTDRFKATAEAILLQAAASTSPPATSTTQANWFPPRLDLRAQRFQDGVQRVLNSVTAGDVYQVNLAWECEGIELDNALEAWLRLRQANPALRGAYLRQGPTEVISNSPELYLEIDGRTRMVHSLPIKGTVAASAGASGRAHLERSAKERAELTMIVDLVRNDLGRVATPGSVQAQARQIRQCGDLLHAEQVVRAHLAPGHDAVDVVSATFPPGSVTGAPKVAAMSVISELEPAPRGIYTGAIGWFADGGGAHFNVAIRTATVVDGLARFHVGAGIVADSDPMLEWNETLAKAQALAHHLGA